MGEFSEVPINKEWYIESFIAKNVLFMKYSITF